MQTTHLISADEFCLHHQVEYSFINSLEQYGLIEIKTIEQNRYIEPEKISDLEKYARLHYDMDINFEGIEAITYLLQRVSGLQDEITMLKNKLRLFEDVE